MGKDGKMRKVKRKVKPSTDGSPAAKKVRDSGQINILSDDSQMRNSHCTSWSLPAVQLHM